MWSSSACHQPHIDEISKSFWRIILSLFRTDNHTNVPNFSVIRFSAMVAVLVWGRHHVSRVMLLFRCGLLLPRWERAIISSLCFIFVKRTYFCIGSVFTPTASDIDSPTLQSVTSDVWLRCLFLSCASKMLFHMFWKKVESIGWRRLNKWCGHYNGVGVRCALARPSTQSWALAHNEALRLLRVI